MSICSSASDNNSQQVSVAKIRPVGIVVYQGVEIIDLT